MGADGVGQPGPVGQRLAVHRDNHVALSKPGALGRPARPDVGHKRAEPAPATPAKDERTITGRNPFDGATVVNLSPAVAEDLGVDPFAARGVMISGIGRGFALNAGLRPGDLIRSVNGRQIQTTRDLAAAAAGASDTWRVTIVRGGEEISATFRS
jgi:membrane-associated protease RseP (regulator of RpoE activity)